ncbi:AAA family ATPase [Micromonospora matsumotoense]|uniref:AAA family ATPase n=1 Tax=Micromonospora matsumotoense TaxID=121616 RepID=UPI003D8E46AE
MSRWSFVGRTDELTRLLAAVHEGQGHGLFLSGSAGIGKSRLLREGVAALPTDRYALSFVAASTATAALPFGGLAPVLPAEQPPGLSPAGVLRWGVEVLQEQAAGRRIVLAIDDAHLLDPPSAALVHLLARAENTTVLGTLRSGEQIPLPIRALWTDDLVAHAELAPLGPRETTGLLAAILAGPVDAGSAERLFRLSAGNPLLLRELVLAAATGGELVRTYGVWRWTGRLELAPSLTDLIDTRIGQLEPGVRAVVELVAFGEPLGLRLLDQAADQADVEVAEERGLITVVPDDRRVDVRLAHPLYGEVIRRRCPVSRTRRLKAQLAERLELVGTRRRGDLLRVAVWRLDSGTAQDPALLLHAAVQAFTRYDVPLATRLARAALDADGGYDAAELLATILMFGDRPAEAIGVLDAVAGDIACEQRRSRWLTVRGMVSYWGLSDESTVDTIAAAGQSLSDPGHQARVRAFEAIMRLHGLDVDAALRLGRSVLDRPAASVAARELARSTIAHADAVRGRFRASATAIDRVQAEAANWRVDMPYLQLAMELARGTWPASTPSRPTNSPTRPAPGTSGSAPATCPSSRRTRRGCAVVATTRSRPASTPAPCSPPAGSSRAWPTPSGPRRRCCAVTWRPRWRRWRRPTGPRPPGWRCSNPGWSRPGARCWWPGATCPGRRGTSASRPTGCAPTASPGTRCWSCTTWSGSARPPPRSGRPAPTATGVRWRSGWRNSPRPSTGC